MAGIKEMTTLSALVVAIACPALAYAQTATLRLTVVDPSNAVIVGARVEVRPAAPTVPVPPAVASDARGDAVFALLEPGRYAIRVEAAGFDTYDARDVRLRAGESRRTVKLAIAKLAETVRVGRDARERASDPRSDAFATVLGAAEIDELPDDPDQMEQVLKEMAGPGAVMRVNGFHGGRLPPKDQIAQIRFHRNMFAADVHEPGFISIDIITKPGLDAWRGSTSVGVRNDLLNARNAFAPVKGDERNERLAFSLNGPLWRKHTSLSLSVDGTNAFDSRTIVAALPSGYFADTIRKPNDALNFSARLEHGLSASQMLRVEAQRNHTFGDNLGVGDFDLTERAYSETRDSTVLRGSIAGSLRKSMFNELRVQWRSQDATLVSRSHVPAILVLNAFNAGGAQIDGTDRETATYVADDLDIASGRHALRAGFLFERSGYRSDVRRNAAGTFTFADLAAYAAGRPTTYTWNDGDPRVSIAQAQFGAYIQDDYRAAKSLTLSGGVREEYQSTIGGLHAAPRGGVVWSPFRNGKTTVRAGGGVFFDWFDAQVYEQAVQLDGAHQRIETIVQPGYPEPAAAGSAIVLPNGRVQLAEDLDQPILREAILGIERQLPGQVRLNAMLIRRRAASVLRGVNLNAPRPDGTRPDPTAGTITQIQSTAASSFDGFSVNLNFTKPERRIFVAANYMLSRSIDEADSPFALAANARDLAAERGPSPTDARHRAMGFVNFPLFGRLTIGSSFRMQSALPYNITTGRDDNGDTISNDRPAGVTRNTGRGRYTIDIGARASWKIGFGGPATTPAGPQVHILRGGADANPLADTMTGGRTTRYSIELYAQAFNMLNRLNALNFSGVTTSPFFGRPTSAAPPRRVEVGARLNF
jgi:Carboxypeptidase regulatory-like domain/TonB dependent receptor